MVELSEEERAELARLREAVGEVDLPERAGVVGEFGPIDPMLAETLDLPFDALDEAEWLAENKYDGTRIIAERFDGEVRLYTRRGVDRAGDLPTVAEALATLPDGCILDGELTFLDPGGTSRFVPVHTGAEVLRRRELTPTLFLFDVLYAGEDVTDLPLVERKGRLADLVAGAGIDDDGDDSLTADALDAGVGEPVAVTPYRLEDFGGFFREVTDAGEEGLILKRRQSRYYPGVRSRQWVKVKRFTERDAVVVGYTEGEGNRAGTFGSLILTDVERYIGRVGSGFTEEELATLSDEMLPREEYPVAESAAGMAYQPVEPFVVSVKYQELTEDGMLRAPVFLRRNSEKPIADVTPVGR